MAFQIGDHVKILDEDGEGIVIGIKDRYTAIVELDGFPFDFPITHLIRVDDDNGLIHQAHHKDFDHLIDNDEKSNVNEVLMHIPIEVFDKVSRQGYPELDLHIHELVDKPQKMNNSEMLEIQVHRLERFIHSCIDKSVSEFVVIHGVGEGVLKIEVRKVLESHGNMVYRDANYQEYGVGATYVKILGLFS
jgi:hypothetical protein